MTRLNGLMCWPRSRPQTFENSPSGCPNPPYLSKDYPNMQRHLSSDFMIPDTLADPVPPAIMPGAFILCPIVLCQAWTVQQCLWSQDLYQLAFQQAQQKCAQRRTPRFS